MKKMTTSNFFLLMSVSRSGRSLTEHVCTNSIEKIETWRVSESIRMPTILWSRTIHQPDRSQTSKKLADSSKPITTRCTLTVLYTRSFQITCCSLRDRVRAFRCRSAFLYAYMRLTHTHMHTLVTETLFSTDDENVSLSRRHDKCWIVSIYFLIKEKNIQLQEFYEKK